MIPPRNLRASSAPRPAGAAIRSAACGRFRSGVGRARAGPPCLLAIGAAALLALATPAVGRDRSAGGPPPASAAPPPTLTELAAAPPSREISAEFGAEKRRQAMRAAALAYGSRGALARRGWELNRLLENLADQLSGVYRFRALLLRRGEFSILPPVAVETASAFRLDPAGRQAATARRILRIVADARIVSAPPHWRDYLVRSWPAPSAPVSALFPRTQEEEERWMAWIAEGWKRGMVLADDIFAADLDRLNRDFEGMVLWRRLRRAQMATMPTLTAERAAVVGTPLVMRIDETVGKLGAPVRFNLQASDWLPFLEGAPETSR